MSRNNDIDPRTLSWIKQESADTLNSVRLQLETFVESGDVAPLAECVENLNRVRGAVEMVGITGATMLAREMRQVAIALVDGRIDMKKDAAEVLMRGVLQLPAYLEHLYHGNADVPIILLPVLNDLRAVQNIELLTEGAFFFADLSVRKPSLVERSSDAPTWDLRTTAKKLRPAYLAALLGIFRDIEVARNLKIVATVILNLEQASTLEKSVQLWWVSAGLVHSLHGKGLELSVAVKLLLGRIDRQIKRVIDAGEVALQEQPPDDVLKNLLYYVARSTSQATRVTELKKAFKLELTIPDAGIVNEARDQLIGFNANLMANVSEQIKEEMLRIKDELDLTLIAKKGDPATLMPVRDRLRMVADTLDILGLQRLARLARGQDEFLQALMDKGKTVHNEDVMHVAGALLYIESSLYDLSVQGNADLLQGSGGRGGTQLPEAEFRQLVKLAANEAVTELMKVKDALGRFVVDTAQFDVLQDSFEALNIVRGVLVILEHERPARIVEATQQYLTVECLDRKSRPSPRAMELVANAVGAVDYFLGSLLEKTVAPDAGLALAERSLNELGYPVRRVARDLAAKYEAEASGAAKPAAPKPVIALVNNAKSSGPDPKVQPEAEVDHELIAVFLTEADDEIAAIGVNLARWREHRDDADTMSALIRSFHTLKGAGRIIGATSIGVLAWSVEELLRRVQEGRVPVNTRLVDLLDQSVTAFTGLVTQIRNGDSGVGPSVQPLIDLARELRQPAQVASH